MENFPHTSAVTFLLSSKSALFPASALIILGFPAAYSKIKGVIRSKAHLFETSNHELRKDRRQKNHAIYLGHNTVSKFNQQNDMQHEDLKHGVPS